MISDIKNLETAVRESYNAKKEIKEISSRLSMKAEQLKSCDILSYLAVSTDTEKSTKLIEEQKSEIESLQMRIEMMEREHPTDKNTILCEECKKAEETNVRIRTALGDGSLLAFKKVESIVWQEQILMKYKYETKNISEAPTDAAVIIPCNSNINAEQKIIRDAIKTLGGRDGLLRQKKQKGEVAKMCISVGFPNSSGEYEQTSREVYYPIIKEDKSSEQKIDVDSIFHAFGIIKSEIIQRNIVKIVIPDIDGETGQTIKRVCGFIFSDTDVEITLYTENKNRQIIQENKDKPDTKKNLNTKSSIPKQETLLVKISGKSYAETLRLVKQSVNPSEIGVDIKGIRKTKKDELLLTIKSGIGKTAALKKEISNKIPVATTTSLIRKKILHIRDMDETASLEEIKQALFETHKISPENMDLRALRPAYGGRQHVTVVMAEHDAIKLLDMGRIKIGWVMCRVIERVTETKCFKCWKYGHTKHQCKGPDRTLLCLKCTKDGHKVTNCPNNPFCVHCNKEGHASGYIKCPNNKTAIPESNIDENGK